MARKALTFMLLTAAIGALPVTAAVVGQTAHSTATVDGALVPAGTTLLSPSEISTGSSPAAVHLATGQTLNLGTNSSARIATTPEGRISLAATRGAVEIGTESGEVFKLASNTIAMLDNDEPGSGDPVVMIEVCDANDKLIEWDAADIKNCSDCYLPNENGECKGKPAGFAWGPGTVAAVAAGTGALGFFIADDDPAPIPCGVPDASGNIPPGTNPPGVGGCP